MFESWVSRGCEMESEKSMQYFLHLIAILEIVAVIHDDIFALASFPRPRRRPAAASMTPILEARHREQSVGEFVWRRATSAMAEDS
jgi:hypothetical protein